MNNTVFVCFVQNNIGFSNGEEEISCLMVTQSQEKIDKWLEKQVAEAEENGYFSDEDINGYTVIKFINNKLLKIEKEHKIIEKYFLKTMSIYQMIK